MDCNIPSLAWEISCKIRTMPAKSLGTLAMIYAIVELQNPLPRKTMLWKGDMNASASTSDAFLQSQGFQLATQHCLTRGGGFHSCC